MKANTNKGNIYFIVLHSISQMRRHRKMLESITCQIFEVANLLYLDEDEAWPAA